jgi:hypothetical protein
LLHDIRRLGVSQKKSPYIRIGSVNRDVEWAEPLPDNPIPVLPAEIGKGYVITMEKGEAIILVLEVKGGSETRRKLVHEAKKASVRARTDRKRLEFKTPGLALYSPDPDLSLSLSFLP